MAIREILTINKPEDVLFLTEPCNKLADPNVCEGAIRDLLDTAKKHYAICLGLAANQIGYLEPLFVIKDLDTATEFEVILQPKVIAVSKGMKGGAEGCLSRPETPRHKVPLIWKRRHQSITMEYIDYGTGEIVRRKFKKLAARIVQHELDHLKGKIV